MSHLISVELDDEMVKEFVEGAHYGSCPAQTLIDEVAEAMVRALEEDDA